eukprot:1364001-Rhodomonas_salina.1
MCQPVDHRLGRRRDLHTRSLLSAHAHALSSQCTRTKAHTHSLLSAHTHTLLNTLSTASAPNFPAQTRAQQTHARRGGEAYHKLLRARVLGSGGRGCRACVQFEGVRGRKRLGFHGIVVGLLMPPRHIIAAVDQELLVLVLPLLLLFLRLLRLGL